MYTGSFAFIHGQVPLLQMYLLKTAILVWMTKIGEVLGVLIAIFHKHRCNKRQRSLFRNPHSIYLCQSHFSLHMGNELRGIFLKSKLGNNVLYEIIPL